MNTTACIAMDIGGTNIRLGLITADGGILTRIGTPCTITEGLDAFLRTISLESGKLLEYAASRNIRVMAAGAGVPGLIDGSGKIFSSVNLQPLEGYNLKEWLEMTLGVPSVTMNDANAAAVAEQAYGSGRTFRSLLHFTLGTGVGSGLILDGKLWTGSDGFAAEYGHATVEPDGLPCSCGNHGCLEQYASATAIGYLAQKLIAAGRDSLLAKLPPASVTTAEVAAAAAKSDGLALECLASAGRYLGIAAATAINMLNLDAILIGGGVAASFDLFAPAIRKEIDKRAFAAASARVKLLPGDLGDNAGLMGAAASAWKLV
jgi:glucokinase